MTEPSFILFLDGAPRDWQRAAEVLDQASPTLALADATRACRTCEGLVPYALPPEEARWVAAKLRTAGLRVAVVPAPQLRTPTRPLTISSGDAYADGFHVQIDLRGTMRVLPWETVGLVQVASVRLTGSKTGLGRWRAGKDAPKPKRLRPKGWIAERHDDPAIGKEDLIELGLASAAMLVGPSIPVLELIQVGVHFREALAHARAVDEGVPPRLERPVAPETWLELHALEAPLRLRIRQAVFDYEYLGARRLSSSRRNFGRLVADILGFAPRAARLGPIEEAIAAQDLERWTVDESLLEIQATAELTRASVKLDSQGGAY